MANNSGIEWTDATWNPVAGCRKVSAGCDHCYAIRSAHRMAGNPNPQIADAYKGLTQIQNGRPNWTGVFRELPDRLDQPLRWRKPKRIFVNSMSDLFGEGISFEFIWRVFEVMRRCGRHQFQVLTKRPERMQDFFRWLSIEWAFGRRVFDRLWIKPQGDCPHVIESTFSRIWPEEFSHVWLGVSVEDQKTADLRIPLLLQTPAVVRFLSCEPLLGPINLRQASVHWVIAGAESGPGARRMDEEWVRVLRNQCSEIGAAFFYKQSATATGQKIHLPELGGQQWTQYPG